MKCILKYCWKYFLPKAIDRRVQSGFMGYIGNGDTPFLQIEKKGILKKNSGIEVF